VVVKQVLRDENPTQMMQGAAAQDEGARLLGAHPEARMPRVLAALPDRLCHVMDLAEGCELAALACGADSGQALYGAGRWLEAFHGVMPVRTAPFQPETLLAPLLRAAEADRTGQRGVVLGRRFQGLIAALAAEAPAVAGLPVAQARLHGDLSGRNILVSDRMVWGIDPAPARVGPVVCDVARLLVFLALKSRDMDDEAMAGIVPTGLAAPFLSAYRRTVRDCPVLHFALRAKLLADWSGLPARAAGLSPAAERRLARIRLLARASFA
jgi:hypothetical protein